MVGYLEIDPKSWRWWRGLPATAIAVKTPIISTASGGCGRSMGGFAAIVSGSLPRGDVALVVSGLPVIGPLKNLEALGMKRVAFMLQAEAE